MSWVSPWQVPDCLFWRAVGHRARCQVERKGQWWPVSLELPGPFGALNLPCWDAMPESRHHPPPSNCPLIAVSCPG